MARAKKVSTGINKIVELALSNKQLLEKDIIRLVSMLSNEEQFAAAEILNGVDEIVELPSPKNSTKIWGHWNKTESYSWNPLRQTVVARFRSYQTVTVHHPYTKDEDILLLKEKFFACTSKDQAKNIVSEGPNMLKVIINKLENERNERSEHYSLSSWNDICNFSDFFEYVDKN